MNLANLKAVVAAYHQKAASDLTVNGVDLFLGAVNNARRAGEQLHDFELARLTATLDIDGQTGAAISDAVIAGNAQDAFSDGSNSYVRQGTFSGYPLYVTTTVDPAKFLYYNAFSLSYVISSTLQISALTNYSTPVTPVLTPAGAYVGHGTGSDVTVTQSAVSTFSSIREIADIQRAAGDGYLQPLDFTSSRRAIQRVRDELEVDDDYGWDVRYPSDSQLLKRNGESTLILRGNRINIYPLAGMPSASPLHVTLEGYGWLRYYDATDLLLFTPSDFFVEYGYEYLQWAAIIELNYLFKTFVPRSEGNLSDPSSLQKAAWEKFLLWDSYLIDPNSSGSR